MSKLGFEDETLRIAPQCLWATRMKTETMVNIAPAMDKVGFVKSCITSAAAFEIAITYFYEDPWERLRLLRKLMPKTPLNFFIRSRNLLGWSLFPNDVVELLLKCIQKTGFEWIEVFDALNDVGMIEYHFRAAKALGLQSAGLLTFSESPVHTDDYYAAKARELVRLGVDSVLLADAAGILMPERVLTLIPIMKQALGSHVKFGFFAHSCLGLADNSTIEAMKLGVDYIKTVSLPLANGDSLPATMDMVYYGRQMGREIEIDEDRLKEIDDYFFWIAYEEKKPLGQPVKFDLNEYNKYVTHQIPGGMMSNLVRQLTELGLLNRMPEVLEEAGRIRQELGYPVMVTPFSQMVGVQALFNVMEGERYHTVPQELRIYAKGGYGQPAAPIDPNALDRILAGADKQSIDPAERFSEPLVSKVRADKGPFNSDEDLLLSLFYTQQTVEKFYQNKKTIESHSIIRTPIAVLIKALANRHDIKTIEIQKGSLKLTQSF